MPKTRNMKQKSLRPYKPQEHYTDITKRTHEPETKRRQGHRLHITETTGKQNKDEKILSPVM